VLKWDIGMAWRTKEGNRLKSEGRLLEGRLGVRALGLGLKRLRRLLRRAEQVQAWLAPLVSCYAGPNTPSQPFCTRRVGPKCERMCV